MRTAARRPGRGKAFTLALGARRTLGAAFGFAFGAARAFAAIKGARILAIDLGGILGKYVGEGT